MTNPQLILSRSPSWSIDTCMCVVDKHSPSTGMQFASVWLWQAINAAGYDMILNDVCCYVPCWFGMSASLFTGLIVSRVCVCV